MFLCFTELVIGKKNRSRVPNNIIRLKFVSRLKYLIVCVLFKTSVPRKASGVSNSKAKRYRRMDTHTDDGEIDPLLWRFT